MADESVFSAVDALEIVQQDAAAFFNIKLSKSGGIHHARDIAHVAEAAFRPCMIGCMSESRLGITAAAHFACAHPIVPLFDWDSRPEHAENRILGGVDYRGGLISLPDVPGIPCPSGDPTTAELPRKCHSPIDWGIHGRHHSRPG